MWKKIFYRKEEFLLFLEKIFTLLIEQVSNKILNYPLSLSNKKKFTLTSLLFCSLIASRHIS